MQPTTKRGWRGALIALLVGIWLYGSPFALLGGYLAEAAFTAVIALLATAVVRATRDRTPA